MTIYILVNYKAKDAVNEDDREDLFTNDSIDSYKFNKTTLRH